MSRRVRCVAKWLIGPPCRRLIILMAQPEGAQASIYVRPSFNRHGPTTNPFLQSSTTLPVHRCVFRQMVWEPLTPAVNTTSSTMLELDRALVTTMGLRTITTRFSSFTAVVFIVTKCRAICTNLDWIVILKSRKSNPNDQLHFLPQRVTQFRRTSEKRLSLPNFHDTQLFPEHPHRI